MQPVAKKLLLVLAAVLLMSVALVQPIVAASCGSGQKSCGTYTNGSEPALCCCPSAETCQLEATSCGCLSRNKNHKGTMTSSTWALFGIFGALIVGLSAFAVFYCAKRRKNERAAAGQYALQ